MAAPTATRKADRRAAAQWLGALAHDFIASDAEVPARLSPPVAATIPATYSNVSLRRHTSCALQRSLHCMTGDCPGACRRTSREQVDRTGWPLRAASVERIRKLAPLRARADGRYLLAGRHSLKIIARGGHHCSATTRGGGEHLLGYPVTAGERRGSVASASTHP